MTFCACGNTKPDDAPCCAWCTEDTVADSGLTDPAEVNAFRSRLGLSRLKYIPFDDEDHAHD